MKRKLAGLALLGGIAAATTLAAPTPPAQAVTNPPLYRVGATSPLDAVNSKTQPISCNGADQVVSAGGRINQGQGDVLMTRMYVDPGLHTVTAVGVEANATNVAWSVEAFAVCAPPGAIANLQLVSVVSPADPFDKTDITAACPAGLSAFGGGYRLQNANSAVAVDELEFDPTLGSVSSTAYVFGAAGNFTLEAQAVCGTPTPLMSLVESESAFTASSPKIWPLAACPAGTQTSAVGGVLTGLVGAGSLATLLPRSALDEVEATGREIVAYNSPWKVRTQQVCVG